MGRLRQVHAAVVQALRETRKFGVVRPLGAVDLREAVADEAAVVVIAALVSRDGKDASIGRQLAVAVRLEQRGHQFAPGQVAGATEQDEIERHGHTTR